MTTFEIGRKAEAVAADFLRYKGCDIIAQNWRTRWCEIDIIATRNDTLYFCEVKYRRQSTQGSGLDYITPQKARQMRFAANIWLATYGWRGNTELCAIEVSGPKFQITAVVKGIDG